MGDEDDMPSGIEGLRGSILPRKATKGVHMESVPQTDTGSRGEYPKAHERIPVKELGKLHP